MRKPSPAPGQVQTQEFFFSPQHTTQEILARNIRRSIPKIIVADLALIVVGLVTGSWQFPLIALALIPVVYGLQFALHAYSIQKSARHYKEIKLQMTMDAQTLTLATSDKGWAQLPLLSLHAAYFSSSALVILQTPAVANVIPLSAFDSQSDIDRVAQYLKDTDKLKTLTLWGNFK